MSKTDITKDIERALILTFLNKNATRIGLEIICPTGIVDFVTIKREYSDEFKTRLFQTTCYEIKVSKQDLLRSYHGHNFIGNYNYYVMPKELYDSLTEEELKTIDLRSRVLGNENIGIILYYKNGAIRTKKKCKMRNQENIYSQEYCNDSLIDSTLMAWQTGSMYKILERYEIVLPNCIKFCDYCKKESISLYDTHKYEKEKNKKLCYKCYVKYLTGG